MKAQRTESAAAAQANWLPMRVTFESRTAEVRAAQLAAGGRPCFMTTERLNCRHGECEWRRECRRLIAVWKR